MPMPALEELTRGVEEFKDRFAIVFVDSIEKGNSRYYIKGIAITQEAFDNSVVISAHKLLLNSCCGLQFGVINESGGKKQRGVKIFCSQNAHPQTFIPSAIIAHVDRLESKATLLPFQLPD